MPLFLDCDLEKLLKPDPGNTELLAQKHRLLGEAVTATKEKLETLKTAAEQANTALANGDISKEQYDVLQREKKLDRLIYISYNKANAY